MTMKVDCLVSNPANKDRLNTSKDQELKSTASSKSTIQICTSFTVTTEKRKLDRHSCQASVCGVCSLTVDWGLLIVSSGSIEKTSRGGARAGSLLHRTDRGVADGKRQRIQLYIYKRIILLYKTYGKITVIPSYMILSYSTKKYFSIDILS